MVTAPIGLVLGIIDLVQKKKENRENKGMAITGIILSIVSLVILIIAFFFLMAIGSSGYNY